MRHHDNRVHCTVTVTELENDSGREVPGVCVECGRCGHQTDAYGTGPSSIRRALAAMREECPEGASNFYMASEGDDGG